MNPKLDVGSRMEDMGEIAYTQFHTLRMMINEEKTKRIK